MTKSIQKVAVIGNGGGGKTTLSRQLSDLLNIPVTHVDSIQFLPGMKVRPYSETIEILEKIQLQSHWLIDGFGPLDLIERRFGQADKVVFVDFPIWRHYWWCTKRQIKSLWTTRSELPEGCNEASLSHTMKLFKTLWKVHTQMRPELLRILGRDNLKAKVFYVRTLKDWDQLFKNGLIS